MKYRVTIEEVEAGANPPWSTIVELTVPHLDPLALARDVVDNAEETKRAKGREAMDAIMRNPTGKGVDRSV